MEEYEKIEAARKAGEQAGRLGLPNCMRPWEYYGGPGRDAGNAWERAYKEAKKKRERKCDCPHD